MNPFVVVPSIALIAVGYVLVPVGLAVYSRYRRAKLLRCPETGSAAEVRVDARRAAAAAAFGRPARVAACSLWPARRGCGQECVELPENVTSEIREPHVV